jgi:hypothetical protein
MQKGKKLLNAVITLIPFIWIIAMVPFANRVKPLVLGLPFLAFWEICGIYITFVCIGTLYRLNHCEEGESDGGEA